MLYKLIENNDKPFFQRLEAINRYRKLLEKAVENNRETLKMIYSNYSNDLYSKTQIKDVIIEFIMEHVDEFNEILSTSFNIDIENFIHENDVLDNIECAVKSAYYMHFRYLYNHIEQYSIDKSFATAIFYFIREYCYSSMFRYNKKGEFNVPYGGISYNCKDFSKKIEYLKSSGLREHLSRTEIYNLDFEDFLLKTRPQENDFIFIDPPYDTDFSTYAQNKFDREDQRRLVDYLTYKCKAKFMLIIKNTDFIFDLYEDKGFNIKIFDKKYLVSFQNRNDKKAKHLLITNY